MDLAIRSRGNPPHLGVASSHLQPIINILKENTSKLLYCRGNILILIGGGPMRRSSGFLATIFITTLSGFSPAFSQTPDVILGELVGARVYARNNGIAAITVGTTSCNAGGSVLNWKQLPDNRHPTI